MSSPTLTSRGASPAARAEPIPARGFAIVIVSAALFGMLGPLSRFAYDAGMEPPAFVAWRATIGFLGLGIFVAWRVRRGDTRLARFGDLPGRARLAMLAAALAGTVLNLCMFIAFDLITIALALLCFYTYPAMVAIANVTLGRERLDGSRRVALGLASAGMVLVVASQLDPAAGIRLDPVGIVLALGAAVSQTIFVAARAGRLSRGPERAGDDDRAVRVCDRGAPRGVDRRRCFVRWRSRCRARTCYRSSSSPASPRRPSRRSAS